MSKAESTTQVLIAAKWMIENVGWCQGRSIQMDESQKPVAFCAGGAIAGVEADFYHKSFARDYLYRVVLTHVPEWNDHPLRTKKQVLKAFDQAIKLSKK